MVGLSPGSQVRSKVLGVVGALWRLGVRLLLILRRSLLVQWTHMSIFVADAVKSFDTVDREILDRVLCSFGLLAWFRHAHFEYHGHVRLRFKFAAGLGEPWTRDGGHSSRLSFEYDVC